MANLYSQSESNVRKTWFLITTFLVLIIILGWLFSNLLNAPGILYFSIIFSILTSISSYWFSDKVVLTMSHAHPLKKEDNPEIYRLVENLCITAGLPLPKIYVLEEDQPNAFATGRDENHAVIALTRGLLEKLERVEIEGVIAHELSHIKNKDILLQTIVVVLVGIVAFLSDAFLRIGFNRKTDEDNNSSFLLALLGIIAVLFAPLAANLLKLAISRQREFLADASGALLTRYPEGLASALEKIASDESELSTATPATAHLFIASPFRENVNWLTKLFMTHPSVEERVRALTSMQID
ncbi:MAG TPA: M48 family metallopeptidase [Candidatus Paceibacterota bacterium]|nr:M48 family metallopeptidase [Candidatus Paceibacterota bacterium]